MRSMRGKSLTIAVLAALAAASLSGAEWKIDPAHSAAQFAVKHLMVSTVRGHFGKMSGVMHWDPAQPAAGKVTAEVDAASIDTRNGKRDDHLRSPDFFDVTKFPTITFESTKFAPGKLTGNLTMHGVTREVTFDVEGPAPPIQTKGGMRTGASATTTISRNDFGMTWNRMIEAGGVTVGDEVTITIDIEMIGPAQ